MQGPKNIESRATIPKVPALDDGQTEMSEALPRSQVNPLSLFSQILRSSRSCQDVLWVAAIECSINGGSWRSDGKVRRESFERWRGKAVSAAAFHASLEYLESLGLLSFVRDGADVSVSLVPDALVGKMFSIFQDRFDCSLSSSPNLKHNNDQEAIDHRSEKRRELNIYPPKIHPDLFGEQAFYGNKDSIHENTNHREVATKLVEFWASRSGRKRVKVLERRVRMVRARIREGYEIEELYQAIAGVCYSPFHTENGWDTFEIAIRNGEQVEKGRRLWQLHAPIEFIEAYEKRTGEVVSCRSSEMRARSAAKERADDFERRLSEARSARDAARQTRHDEARRDEEATALALEGLDGGEG